MPKKLHLQFYTNPLQLDAVWQNIVIYLGCAKTVASLCMSNRQFWLVDKGGGTPQGDLEFTVAQQVRGIKRDKQNQFRVITRLMRNTTFYVWFASGNA